MKEAELISIVIPVYNVELYIERCLDSIIAQTYKNIEIILVDDGSTDNSGRICDEYEQKDLRVKVVHKENGGLSDARNVGIKHSKGELIAFVDSDDYIAQDYISYLHKLLKSENADIAVCGYLKGKRTSFPKEKRKQSSKLIFNSQEMMQSWHGKYKRYETVAWNKLYKRDLFEVNNIYYPEGYYHEDMQTTHLIVSAANKIVIGERDLYYYYQRSNSIMSNVSEKRIQDNMYAHSVRLKFFLENGYKEAVLRLRVGKQKQCMYYYYLASKHHKDDIRKKLLDIFRENYVDLMKQSISITDKILFFIFEKYLVLDNLKR